MQLLFWFFVSSIGLIFAATRKWNLNSAMKKEAKRQCLSVTPAMPPHVRINTGNWVGTAQFSVRCVHQAICNKDIDWGVTIQIIPFVNAPQFLSKSFVNYTAQCTRNSVFCENLFIPNLLSFSTHPENGFSCWRYMWQNLSLSAPVFCYHPWTVTFTPLTRIIFKFNYFLISVNSLLA